MDLKEIKNKKNALESLIQSQLVAFSQETGVYVSELNYELIEYRSGAEPDIVNRIINVKLKLKNPFEE